MQNSIYREGAKAAKKMPENSLGSTDPLPFFFASFAPSRFMMARMN
jgi:hypothetical protein